MRIGINGLYLSTPYSGIGQYTINLLRALSEIDHTNKYFIFTNAKIKFEFPANFRVIKIDPIPLFPKSFLSRFIWEEYQLGSAIRKYKLDIFHGLYQSLPRGVEKIGSIATIHDAIPWRFPAERKQLAYRWYSDIRKNLLTKRAKKIVSISETTKLDLAPIYGMKPETIEVTYESVDSIFFTTPTEKEINDCRKKFELPQKYILYSGGLKRHKNLRMLIKSFSILAKTYKYPGDLLILGAVRNTMAVSKAIYYKPEDLMKYAKLMKVGDRVHIVGFISRSEMSTLLHTADAFISLSLYEGFGLPALEAVTAGIPAVLSRIGAFQEVIKDAGVYVYPYGPHRIAEELNSVLIDQKVQVKLKQQAKKRAVFFDQYKIAQRILEIYQEVYDDCVTSFEP